MQPPEQVARILRQPNPYTEVVLGLWSLLESSSDFCTLVAPGNRIKFLGESRSPIKTEVSDADLPEVRIVPTGSTPHAHAASNMHRETVRYEVQLSTGDQRLDALVNPLRWIITRAMLNVHDHLKNAVMFAGLRIVVLARPSSVTDGVSQADMNRQIRGWAALWACEVDTVYPASAIRP